MPCDNFMGFDSIRLSEICQTSTAWFPIPVEPIVAILFPIAYHLAAIVLAVIVAVIIRYDVCGVDDDLAARFSAWSEIRYVPAADAHLAPVPNLTLILGRQVSFPVGCSNGHPDFFIFTNYDGIGAHV